MSDQSSPLALALAHLSYDRQAAKVGIVPVCFHGEGGRRAMKFLLHRPKNKNPKDTSQRPFALARGSVEALLADGTRVDVRDEASLAIVLADARLEKLEDPAATALREAEQELGIAAADVIALMDLGTLRFTTVNQETGRHSHYGIHWFGCAIRPRDAAQLRAAAVDSADVAWMTLEDARLASQEGRFNAKYLPVMEAAAGPLEAWLKSL